MPIFTSSPGDSSIGMNLAALSLEGSQLAHRRQRGREPVGRDRLAREGGGRQERACWILGGGSPKNFMLQTEPQIQEVLGLAEAGHDYFLQFTDARPDTGGLSGATPGEAMTWGKVDPDKLPDAVVSTSTRRSRCRSSPTTPWPRACAATPKRLYERLPEFMELLKQHFAEMREERIARRGAIREDG